ncbi:hypothetical protein MRX96_040865 [Rhipicephalus microplus]
MREAPCYFRQPVQLSLVCVVNEDDRSVVVVLRQEAHLRRVAQRPPNGTGDAQVQVDVNASTSHGWQTLKAVDAAAVARERDVLSVLHHCVVATRPASRAGFRADGGNSTFYRGTA